jgi:16S rRNA G966 N2-methylase RsmD
MRIEGKLKMGYYPTPVSIIERIKTFLDFSHEYTVLDPCAGEGEALSYLVDENGKTYGIELNYDRYTEAKKKLHKVLYGGYEQLKAPQGAFSILFLNPPYDYDTDGERQEKKFLSQTIKYLCTGGILIYIIPQNILEKTAKILSYAFSDIQIYRFTEDEYQSFKQVVVFGIKKKNKKVIDKNINEIIKAQQLGTKLPEIPILQTPIYKVPPMPMPKYFSNGEVDKEELENYLNNSNLFKNIKDSIESKKEENRPPMPLHMAHIGLLLATGYLNGEMDGHIVKGVVKKTKVKNVESKEDGTKVIKETEKISVGVNILTKDGKLIELL